jgi:hypothetical protein
MPESKEEKIERVKANLPLPEDPPAAPDWQTADARTTGTGSGSVSGDVSVGPGSTAGLREPATKSSEDIDMSRIGRQGVEGRETPPKDAAAKGRLLKKPLN